MAVLSLSIHCFPLSIETKISAMWRVNIIMVKPEGFPSSTHDFPFFFSPCKSRYPLSKLDRIYLFHALSDIVAELLYSDSQFL